ncbi:MAG: polyprenyl synthetase family protein [Nitrospirae bacterium]|nr:MAG: polyprenyl synthetase family protein [Nitrospirota bacterium]
MHIEAVWQAFHGDLARVEAEIRRHLHSDAALIPEVGSYLLEGGGKRIRPLLALLSARLVGYDQESLYTLASIIEYLHTASLLHDDVVDMAQLRRGHAAANSIWGNQVCVLVGDYFYAMALHLAVGEDSLEIMEILSSATAYMVKGELLQMAHTKDVEITREQYERVITCKTANLMSAACALPAVAAAADAERKEGLKRYGRHLGIAFQMVDDTLDYVAEEERLGKLVGKDLMEGKVTLPLILLLERASAADRPRVEEIILKDNLEPPDLKEILLLLDRYAVLEACMEVSGEHVRRAKEALSPFPASEARDACYALADFVVERDL